MIRAAHASCNRDSARTRTGQAFFLFLVLDRFNRTSSLDEEVYEIEEGHRFWKRTPRVVLQDGKQEKEVEEFV